jgi:very-short-patch-repair endonuclease
MAEGAPLILDLLTYIERVEKLKSTPAFNVPDEYLVGYQHELEGLPEIRLNSLVGADDVWLRVPRLREIPPPNPGEALSAWITLSPSPELAPTLNLEPRSELDLLVDDAEEVDEHLDRTKIVQIKALLAEYVSKYWEPWAKAERPRRVAIARYERLFLLQQTIASQTADSPLELVWGMGFAVWKKDGYPAAIQYPLILQPCEIALNGKTFDLEVRPRAVEPRLEVDVYADVGAPGLPQLEAFWQNTLAGGTERVNPFDESTFEEICSAAARYLDPNGAYVGGTGKRAPPLPSGTLKITNTWVLFARRRSSEAFLTDLRNLKKKVENALSLPAAVRRLVDIGEPKLQAQSEQPSHQRFSSQSSAKALEPYFPKPYNDEQLSVVQMLDGNDGVVVQGAPGTGKTHTIANVICHYLARGQRVLVTAESEGALAALREQLPERIRPLSVALLSDEREGMRQFDQSIRDILTTAWGINPVAATAKIAGLELRMHKLQATISEVDETIAAFASKHLSTFRYRGRDVSPQDMAKLVVRQAQEHEWFDDDVPLARGDAPHFDESHISALREARNKVGENLPYLGCSLPNSEEFPEWSELLSLHRDLVRNQGSKAKIGNEGAVSLIDSQPETFRKARALLQFLEDRAVLKRKIEAQNQPWFATFYNRLANVQQPDPALLELLRTCAVVQRLETNRRQLLAQAVVIPTGVELNQEFSQTVERLAAGETSVSVPFGKTHLRRLLNAVRVCGTAPKTKESWYYVALTLRWCVDARATLSRWNELAREFGMEPAGYRLESDFKAMLAARGYIGDLRRLAFDFDAMLPGRFEEVFVREPSSRLWNAGEASVSLAVKTLKELLDVGGPGYAMYRIGELLRGLEKHSGGIVKEIRSFLTSSLGRVGADESVLQTTWVALQAELSRLTRLRPHFEQITSVTGALHAAGAVKWAQRLQTQPATGNLDPLIPSKWYKAWNWRRACMFLDQIEGHDRLRKLFEARKALTASLVNIYQDLVAEKSWLSVLNDSPDSVRQALRAYLETAQARAGRTGQRAVRQRKLAREAMDEAGRAIPCWILPRWRVSEIMPPELGLFDLVVIDEASQADLRALPVSLRGKKILVIGDQKQVSPSSVGMTEPKFVKLTTQFLANQPLGLEMTPGKSLFDLARAAFSANPVVFKEHYRSVPAIIEFSNQEFYSGNINPLRLLRDNARMNPPLVDIFVKGGSRKGDVNAAEATAVVDEIESLLADPQFAGKSIGVVTLFGNKQAAYIQELINERVSPADIVARKIMAAPPAAFQGRERDIMMISMVLAPGDDALPDRPEIRQYFNVALTRARDRMYLFRSVADGALDEASLNARVIRHFKKPIVQEVRKIEELRERCESGFERAIFDELVKRNYRVEPQVRCGAYRMDLVVEGSAERRLAIECDGDRLDGPSQWAEDMARQRVLERAGWTFWRCFASSFVRRREEVIADLIKTLQGLGIEPMDAECAARASSANSEELDPPGVEHEREVA